MAINSFYTQIAIIVLTFSFTGCSTSVKEKKIGETQQSTNDKSESADNTNESKSVEKDSVSNSFTNTAQSGIEKKEIQYKLGEDTTINAIVYKNKGKSETFFFNLHDNENTSVDATIEHIQKHGGTFLELKHTGERLIEFDLKGTKYKFDPNRMFSDIGIKKDLNKYNRNAKDIDDAAETVKKFANKLVKDFIEPNKSLIVTVHNNTENGGLTINTYKPDTLETAYVFVAKDEDVDNFFYVTEKKHFDTLANGEFNVVMQNNEFLKENKSIDDGSLSVYCGLKEIPYINVETQHGNAKRQAEMLEALAKVLAKN